MEVHGYCAWRGKKESKRRKGMILLLYVKKSLATFWCDIAFHMIHFYSYLCIQECNFTYVTWYPHTTLQMNSCEMFMLNFTKTASYDWISWSQRRRDALLCTTADLGHLHAQRMRLVHKIGATDMSHRLQLDASNRNRRASLKQNTAIWLSKDKLYLSRFFSLGIAATEKRRC